MSKLSNHITANEELKNDSPLSDESEDSKERDSCFSDDKSRKKSFKSYKIKFLSNKR